MKQQKKDAKSRNIIQKNVGVDAHIDPHFNENALNKCRGDFNRPRYQGITLISLVITIVIMLILAGVAISIVVSPEGLFDHAKNATEKWGAKVTEEQGKVDEALGYLDILGGAEAPELNEFNFYFGQPYSLKMDETTEITSIMMSDSNVILYANGQYNTRAVAEYIEDEENGNTVKLMGMTVTISEDGTQIAVPGYGTFTLGSENITASVEEEDYIYYKTVDGWNAMAKDPTKATYGEIKSTVKGMPLVGLEFAFVNCTNLTTAPVIPRSVTNISKVFYGCSNLEGTVTINGTPIDYSNCFSGTQKPITLAGTSQNLENIARYYSNVAGLAPVVVAVSTNYPEGWDSNKLSGVARAGENMAPIPKGFRASSVDGENSITGGLVIYQGEEDVTSTNHSTALTSRNQYVWIPVEDINQMVMCKGNTSTSICNIEKQQNGTLKCKTHGSDDLCGRLYGVDYNLSIINDPTYLYEAKMNFANRSQTWEQTGYREPDIVSYFDVNDTETNTDMKDAGIESGLVSDFEAQLKQYFKEMVASVEKYGGFYVSRYEVGYEEVEGTANKGISKKGKKVLTAATSSTDVYQGVDNWYGLYGAVNKQIKEGEEVILQSHMIYGSQYDQVIRFIGSEAQEGHIGNVVTGQSVAGSKEEDKLNNIYDLEGNNHEWTSQANTTYYRVLRGGNYNHAGSDRFNPASDRYDSNPTLYDVDSDRTTRSTLYVAL